MALSEADKQYLNADQQKQISALKDAWAAASAAGDQAGMAEANKQAEAIRAQAGYSGGADGSQANQIGGLPADYVRQWAEEYRARNLSPVNGWDNGYSVDMNLRSMANFIRQQMQANSDAWATADAETRQYLHDQNQQLAKILEQNNGGAQSVYNEALGRWETGNANLGYGYNVGQYNDPEWYKNVYGMTDDQIEKYRNETDRYRNFVDQRVIRNWVDDSSGYTGIYSQFVNGPFGQLLSGGTKNTNPWIYTDVIGDGFNDAADSYVPVVDGNGTIIPQAPALKNANDISDYTRQFTAWVDENGVIQPGTLPGGTVGSGVYGAGGAVNPYQYDPAAYTYTGADYSNVHGDPRNIALEKLSGLSASGGSSGTGSGGLQDYINQMYDASLQSQLAQLEAAYQESLAELEKSQTETDAAYNEQKRQTQGDAERNAANWRELAMAQGLNTGAMGQAALAQNNQLQSNLNTLSTAQQQALDNIRNQRTLLGKQYQLQILQAQADNDFERAQALYSEAVRMDEILREQEQQALSMMQSLLSKVDGISYGGLGYQGALAAAGLGGSDSDGSRNTDGGTGQWMSDAESTKFQNTLQQLARANQTDRVFSQIENNMVKLSPDQQDQVEEFLNRWGRG